MRAHIGRDTLTFIGAGLVAILVFAGNAWFLSRAGYIDLGASTTATFAVGFGVFMLIYFVSMSLHRVFSRDP